MPGHAHLHGARSKHQLAGAAVEHLEQLQDTLGHLCGERRHRVPERQVLAQHADEHQLGVHDMVGGAGHHECPRARRLRVVRSDGELAGHWLQRAPVGLAHGHRRRWVDAAVARRGGGLGRSAVDASLFSLRARLQALHHLLELCVHLHGTPLLLL